MALNEEARARRFEWRAGVLAYADPADDVKAKDRAVFEKAARLARRIAETRPAFEVANDELEAQQAEDTAAWIRGGRQGDKPTNTDAYEVDPAIQLFRSARDDYANFYRTDEYRAAVGRSRLDNWTEPTDEELLAS